MLMMNVPIKLIRVFNLVWIEFRLVEPEPLVFVEKVPDIVDRPLTVIDELLKFTPPFCYFCTEAVWSWSSYCVM